MVKVKFYDVLRNKKYGTHDSVEKLVFNLDENGPQYKIKFIERDICPLMSIDSDKFVIKMFGRSNVEITNDKQKKSILDRLYIKENN